MFTDIEQQLQVEIGAVKALYVYKVVISAFHVCLFGIFCLLVCPIKFCSDKFCLQNIIFQNPLMKKKSAKS